MSNRGKNIFLKKYANKIFGMFTISKQLPDKFIRDRHYMLCEGVCNKCGLKKEFLVHLLNKTTKYCECFRKEKREVAVVNSLFWIYKQEAKKRNLEFNISFQRFSEITKQNCIYCNVPPSKTHKRTGVDGSYTYNGIDRKDNTVGYLEGNVQPCCFICNMAKSNNTEEDFLDWSERLHRNQNFQLMDDLYQNCHPVTN